MKAAIALFAIGTSFASIASDNTVQSVEARRIVVTGKATLQLPPDYVSIRVAISTVSKSCEAAYSANTQKVNSAIEAIRVMGIPQKDITTDYVSLSKKERERDKEIPIIEYEASNKLTIQLRDLSKYDTLLSTIIALGVNRVEGASFKIQNEAARIKEARLLAIKAAKEKADYLAAALLQKVCAPISISENQSQIDDECDFAINANYTEYTPPEIVQTSLVPHTITVSASVNVVFRLCD